MSRQATYAAGPDAPLCAICQQDTLHGDRAGSAACAPCEDWTAQRLAAVARMWEELPAYLVPVVRAGGERVASSPAGSRPPLRLDVLALTGPGGAPDVLARHAEAWRAARGLAAVPARGDGGRRLAAALAFLTAHLSWACEHLPAVADLAQDLADLTGRMRAATGATGEADEDPTEPLDLPCPAAGEGGPCGGELRYDPRKRVIVCAACAEVLPATAWLALGAA